MKRTDTIDLPDDHVTIDYFIDLLAALKEKGNDTILFSSYHSGDNYSYMDVYNSKEEEDKRELKEIKIKYTPRTYS